MRWIFFYPTSYLNCSDSKVLSLIGLDVTRWESIEWFLIKPACKKSFLSLVTSLRETCWWQSSLFHAFLGPFLRLRCDFIDSNVPSSIRTLEILSPVSVGSLLVTRKVDDPPNLQNQLLFWRDLFWLDCQRVLRTNDIQFWWFCWAKFWTSATIGTTLVVEGESRMARFWETGFTAAADLHNVVVLVLLKMFWEDYDQWELPYTRSCSELLTQAQLRVFLVLLSFYQFQNHSRAFVRFSTRKKSYTASMPSTEACFFQGAHPGETGD